MHQIHLSLFFRLFVLLLTISSSGSIRAAEFGYLFTSFRGNGESGLHLAYSSDGYHFEALNENRPVLTPKVGQGLMRDPSIVRGPDGVFHMVWTTGWWDRGFGVAHSKDLMHWSEQQFIPAMDHEPTARNTWAPEIFWDDKNEHYVIYWASAIPGHFPATDETGDDGLNHRIYCTTTRDFGTFSDTRLFYEPGFNVIDATVVHRNGGYTMILKDETRHPPAKNLRVAHSESLNGPWSDPSVPFTPDGVWVEGPTVAKVGDSYLVYYDRYLDKKYGAMKTANFKSWENVTDKLTMPAGSRHGSIIKEPREMVEALR